VIALTKLFVRDAHSPQAHRSTMCKRANRHISDRIRYWRVDICAGTLRSPLERDGPLLWPLRTGCGALHAHARARATPRGRPLPKLRGKRVRHGRKRESRSAGAHRPSKRIAAFSAARGPAEPRRRRSRAGRHHRAPGHQTAHGNHTGDAQHCQLLGWKHGSASGNEQRAGARGEIGGEQRAGARHTTLKKCPA